MTNPDSNRSPDAARRTSSVCSLRPLTLAALALASLSPSGWGQGVRVAVSTTDDVPGALGLPFPVTDGDLVSVEAGQAVRPFLAGGHFLGSAGFIPGDIDGFSRLPSPGPGRASAVAFSLLSNEASLLDGDILTLSEQAGTIVLISEVDIATALGDPSANIDVDAFTFDDQGRLVFSLASDLASSALGALQDGDILVLDTTIGFASRLMQESEVQARVTQATGLSDAILDVQALDWAGGELWVAVQSPSRHDGSILALNGTPRIVVDENDLGLGGAELDSLGVLQAGDGTPSFHMTPGTALEGDTVHVEVFGRPGDVVLAQMAGRTGLIPFNRFPGFGAWMLDRTDPWYTSLLASHSRPLVMLDGAGRFSADFRLPPGTEFGIGFRGDVGWSFQVVDLATLELSAPFRILHP